MKIFMVLLLKENRQETVRQFLEPEAPGTIAKARSAMTKTLVMLFMVLKMISVLPNNV